MVISSHSNPQVKNIIALQKRSKIRKEQGVFVIEGVKMLLEAPGDRVEKVYVSESFKRAGKERNQLERYSCEVVSDSVFQSISATSTPQGVLAMVKCPHYDLNRILESREVPKLLILETIQDPGNLGTMLRTGEGTGVTGIIMDSTTADIYNPKAIRSTMGSIYRVPFVYVENLQEAVIKVKEQEIHVFAALLKGERDFDQEDYTKPTGFLIGNEANGLSDEITALADSYIKIPMAGAVESLNAAIAASLLLYEAFMQRRR